jgi:hypothetical protein
MLFPVIFCPECGRKARIVEARCRKYIFQCTFCPYNWREELTIDKKDDDSNVEIDAMLLGIEIFEVAYACMFSLDRVSSRKGCSKILKYFQSFLSAEDDIERLKETVIKQREKNIWVDYKIQEFVENYGTEKDKVTKDCIKILKNLQSLLLEIEDSWGLVRLRKVLISVEWAIKELREFAQEAEGKTRKEAEKILSHIDMISGE